jgi:LPXTG-site transpeptidase (sortase) family protein
MRAGLSRRRALARGLALLGTLTISLNAGQRPTYAQSYDPPSDVPWPSDGAPSLAPSGTSSAADATPVAGDSAPAAPVAADATPAATAVADDTTTEAPFGQASNDSQPAFMPNPENELPTNPAAAWGVAPIKLTIPALGVEAAIEAVGNDPDGAMSAPSDPDEVAWYQLGPGMGVPGNVVFAGHVNWGGRLRVFGEIDKLDVGDAIQVIDAEGRGFQYAVESTRLVRAEGAPLDEIFEQPNQPVVTLITCGGEYVPSRREYLDRVIVRATGA